MKEKFLKLKKYFGEYDMTWKRVILFALITAVYTAAMCIIPFLEDTSFHDIAVTPECWVLFAVFIVVNCKTWYEASLKCFVFFLISQPLIYLLQVPFSSAGWGIFHYYKYWFMLTLLTLPGAAVCFLVKKKNLLSVLVLTVATAYLAYQGASFAKSAIFNFPHHLLSTLFCLALIVFLIFVLFDKKNLRTLALAAALAALIASVFLVMRSVERSKDVYIGEGSWSYNIEDESVVSVELSGESARLRAGRDGNTLVVFEDEKGRTVEYDVTVYCGSMLVTEWGND